MRKSDLKEYKICYKDKDGDISKVWVEAYTPKEAEKEAYSEYWDIEYIISVTEI